MHTEVIREVDPAQLAEVQELLDAARERDGHTPLGEHKWLDLVHGGREGYAGIVVREPGHDHALGYAHLSAHRSEQPVQWGLEVVVHPQHRGIGVEARLVEESLELVAGQGGGHLHLWVFQPTEIHEAVAHRFGLAQGRDLLHMVVTLPVDEDPEIPPGIQLRAFRPGQDDEAWLEVNNRAFSHHPEQGAWTKTTLERRMGEDWFEADGFLLAVDDAGVAGFCWVKPDREAGRGEIYVIGVDPSRQGSGLGRTLVLAGLRWMAGQGLETGTLYVDAANEPAVRLYRDLGFEVHHLDRAYVADIDPA